MRYFDWIDKYNQGELSLADQQAFEHEYQENSLLKEEVEAIKLTEALLKAASTHNSLNQLTIPAKSKWPYYLLIGLTLISISIFSWLSYTNSSHPDEKQDWIPSFEQNWNPILMPEHIEPTQLAPPIAKLDHEPLFENGNQKNVIVSKESPKSFQKLTTVKSGNSTIQKPKVIAGKLSSKNKSSKEISASKKGRAIYTVKAVLDSALSEQSSLALTATEIITLKPGFHAKTGTFFKAKIDNKPLFSVNPDLDD